MPLGLGGPDAPTIAFTSFVMVVVLGLRTLAGDLQEAWLARRPDRSTIMLLVVLGVIYLGHPGFAAVWMATYLLVRHIVRVRRETPQI